MANLLLKILEVMFSRLLGQLQFYFLSFFLVGLVPSFHVFQLNVGLIYAGHLVSSGRSHLWIIHIGNQTSFVRVDLLNDPVIFFLNLRYFALKLSSSLF